MIVDSFQCDYCNENPICGTRWHCMTCDDDSIDFCSDCLISQLQNESPHPMSHTFVAFRVTTDMQTQSDDDNEDDEEYDDDADDEDIETIDENGQIDETHYQHRETPI